MNLKPTRFSEWVVHNEPKTKVEASTWLNYYVPIYRKKCEEQELEWEANNSDLVSNWGDWQ